MMIGGDFDGDTFSALFYDESFKDFMLGRVQEMRKMASGKSHLPIIEKEGDFDLFYNFKTHGYTIPRDAKTVIDKLRKESASEKSFSGGILSDVINRLHSEEFWKQAEDNSVLAKQTIKKSAGLTGHMLSNVGRFVDQLGVTLEKQSEFRQVLNRLLEYNVKQKRLLASEQHPMLILIEGMLNPTPENPVYKTIDDIAKYQADPGAMTDLPIDKETGSRFIRLPEIPNARDVQLGTLSGLRYPHEGAKDLYGKIMNQPIDPSLQEWARTIFDNEKGIALLGLKNRSELQGRQITLWEFFKAMELEKKGRLKYGVESMIGKNATGLDILLRAMKDKPVGGYGMEFTSLIADMGDYYSTESLSQSIAKSWRKNAHPKAQKFIKKAMTVPNFFGVKGAMIGVAGYMLYNLFQPDQMNSGLVKVGRMPGTGGEKWDYTFARDERAYDPLMQTPLGNPYDLPKAYLNLLDPNYQKSMRRGIEKRRNYTISHRTTGFGGRQLTRNSYSSPSIPR